MHGTSKFIAAAVLLAAGCSTPHDGEAFSQSSFLPGGRPVSIERAQEPSDGEPSPLLVGTARGLTVNDCKRLAVANSRRLSAADRRVLIAESRVSEAWASVMPRLSATVQGEARNNDRGIRSRGIASSAGDRESAMATVSLIVPIYDFGGSANQRDALRAGVDLAGLDVQQTRQDLTYSVAQAYYRLLEARKIQSVVDESVSVISRQLAMARDFAGEGLVARNDVLAVEVQLAARNLDSIRAASNVELASATLNRLIGLPVDTQPVLSSVLDAVAGLPAYADILKIAIDRRTDLAFLKKQVELAQSEYAAQRASGLYPKVYAFGDYNYSTDSFLLNDDWLRGGIAIQLPLFDGGVTWARLNQIEERVGELRDLHSERTDDIVLEIKSAYLQVRDASERLPVAQKAIGLAEENLRVTTDLYGEGLLTSADLLDEEERLSQARSSHYQALYDYHAAVERLAYVSGNSLPGKGE